MVPSLSFFLTSKVATRKQMVLVTAIPTVGIHPVAEAYRLRIEKTRSGTTSTTTRSSTSRTGSKVLLAYSYFLLSKRINVVTTRAGKDLNSLADVVDLAF